MQMLWTDYCFLSMLIIIVLAILVSLRKPPAREVIKRLLRRPMAVSTGIIVFLFLIIAVLDSLHIEHQSSTPGGVNTESVTVLDAILAPLGEVYEKTYSAPLALQLYAKETIVAHGAISQIYPRLQYPPAWIKNDEIKKELIIQKAMQASEQSLLFIILFSFGYWFFRYFMIARTYRFSKQTIAGLSTLFVAVFCALLSYKLSRHFHLFGTGKIGQDIFYYTLKSIRTGLVIGTLTTLFMLPLGIILGIAAGYFGGLIDDVIQYIYTVLSSIPGVLLITASVLSMQTYIANHPLQFPTLEQSADARLFALCLILGVTSWTSLCRLLRAEALKYREIDFVLAAKALGTKTTRIIWKHLLPNMMPIVLITLVLDFSFLVMAEALLSYVGVGVSPMTISWGNMINGARLELARDPLVWWPMFAAFLFMFILVLASNLFADAVRDALDPHHV